MQNRNIHFSEHATVFHYDGTCPEEGLATVYKVKVPTKSPHSRMVHVHCLDNYAGTYNIDLLVKFMPHTEAMIDATDGQIPELYYNFTEEQFYALGNIFASYPHKRFDDIELLRLCFWFDIELLFPLFDIKPETRSKADLEAIYRILPKPDDLTTKLAELTI
jgi:hypothetical protein